MSKENDDPEMEYCVRHSDGEIVTCDSCGSEAPTSEFSWGPPYTEKHAAPYRLLCEFCAKTMTGIYTRDLHNDEYSRLRAEIWKSSACVFNMLSEKSKP